MQLWRQFFQNFVYGGDVVYAQTWEVLALKNCIEPLKAPKSFKNMSLLYFIFSNNHQCNYTKTISHLDYACPKGTIYQDLFMCILTYLYASRFT